MIETQHRAVGLDQRAIFQHTPPLGFGEGFRVRGDQHQAADVVEQSRQEQRFRSQPGMTRQRLGTGPHAQAMAPEDPGFESRADACRPRPAVVTSERTLTNPSTVIASAIVAIFPCTP